MGNTEVTDRKEITAQELKEIILDSIIKTLKVEKLFDEWGCAFEDPDHTTPVHLEDFSVTFSVPVASVNGFVHEFIDKEIPRSKTKIEFDVSVRTIKPADMELIKSKRTINEL